jgi:crotonobetainyl-CoA:carnitine CoA-transferase CaiB-like acyl-CoA transferase
VRHATVVPYGAYRCGDGNLVLFSVQTQKQWVDFCTLVCGHPEWIDDPRFDTTPHRREHRDILEPLIEEAFAPFTRAEVNARLEAADIPFGDLNTIEQFLEHPQLAARDRWRTVGSPAGPLQAILPPFLLEGAELMMGDIPAAGEQTDAILTGIGYRSDEIAALRAAGIL